MSTTDTKVDELIINTLTKAQYDDLVANNQVEANQLYLTKDEDYYMQIDVTYGTTTYAQITSALGAKQEPVCNYNSYQYTYAGNDGTYYYFTCAINNEIKYVRVNSASTWSNGTASLQTTISDLGTIRANASLGASAVQPSDLATVATTGSYTDLTATPSLSTVATSGSYNDLLNKPTIPTVNNASLIIQKNATTVSTFTANASANVTCNIIVPTKTSELTNNSGFITGITANNVTVALGYTPYNSTNPNGYTSNTGTVRSVQVQAGTGLTSSTSTAQDTTLSTTIGIDSNYKLPTTTEWDGKQNTISDLGYIRNQVSKVDDKISTTDVIDSGSSLPSASGYNINDTFLNSTDKKIYKVEAPAYALNSGVTKSDNNITVNLTTGVVNGFIYNYSQHGSSSWNYIINYNISPLNPIYIHFNSGPRTTTYGSTIATFAYSEYGTNYYTMIKINNTDNKFYMQKYKQNNYSQIFEYQILDTEIEANTEYYLYLNYENGDYIITLSSTGYNTNIIETSTLEDFPEQISHATMYYGGPSYFFCSTLEGMSVYLLDSTGNFLVADGDLTWDSGTILEDNTQYNDVTNEKTYYYHNNILYMPVQAPKFLTFTNTTASTWVSDNTYVDYGYKCVLTCNGVTVNDYAQITFAPTEANSGNYANVCLTDTNSVTIYGKVNTSITIPTIIVLGA